MLYIYLGDPNNKVIINIGWVWYFGMEGIMFDNYSMGENGTGIFHSSA